MNKTRNMMCAMAIVALAVAALTGCKGRNCGNGACHETVMINGHEYVDLQLPSGVLWAKTNVGAETETDYGEFYAWGETKPKQDCSQETYLYGTDFDKMTKYDTADRKTTLSPADDAATANWGDGCRMPTEKEFMELGDTANCTWTWVKKAVAANDTIAGYEVKSVRNGNAIFLPAAGARNGKDIVLQGDNAVYWTCTRDANVTGNAACLSFYFANYSWYKNARYIGGSVRAVAKPDAKDKCCK